MCYWYPPKKNVKLRERSQTWQSSEYKSVYIIQTWQSNEYKPVYTILRTQQTWRWSSRAVGRSPAVIVCLCLWCWTSQSSQERLPGCMCKSWALYWGSTFIFRNTFWDRCGKVPSHTTDPVSFMDLISPFLVFSFAFFLLLEIELGASAHLAVWSPGVHPQVLEDRKTKEITFATLEVSLWSPFSSDFSFICLPASVFPFCSH